MKAREVLRLYAAGERNFQNENLRGQSFKRANLAGADFSGADIRSTNFTGANLIGANFTGAKCGLQKRWAIFLTLISWLLAGMSGFIFLVGGALVPLISDSSSSEKQIAGLGSIIILLLLFFVFSRWGIGKIAIIAVAAATVVAGIVVIAATAFGVTITGEAAGEAAVTVAGAAVAVVVITGLVAVVGLLANVVLSAVVSLIAVAGAAVGVVAAETDIVSYAVTSIVAITAAMVGVYIGWRTLKGDEKDAWLHSFAIASAAVGGTSFRNANLTDANFASARLKSTDLRNANLTRVCWFGAKMLDRVRPGNSYLKNAEVRQWLIGSGKTKCLDRQDLRGVNLQGANLTNVSFIASDLSEANLQDTDLSRAKLVQTQLDNTDLTGATLTGAFIEDWGITSSTVLNGIRCDYVFMRLPPEKRPKWLPLPVAESSDDNPRRKPDNWSETFKDDDFANFIKPIKDTLDLYHSQDIDPRAMAISWKKLEEDNPNANLKFSSLEVKGEDNLLLRLKTAPDTDLSRLNSEYFENYNQLKALNQTQQALLAEKDSQIKSLENLFKTALNISININNHQGDNKMEKNIDQSRKIDISGREINVSGAGALNLGEISGKVANTISKIPDSSNDKTNIKELLSKLKTAIKTEPNLVDIDKSDALEEIDKLALMSQEQESEEQKQQVGKSIRILQRIAKDLPAGAALLTICKELLPVISSFF